MKKLKSLSVFLFIFIFMINIFTIDAFAKSRTSSSSRSSTSSRSTSSSTKSSSYTRPSTSSSSSTSSRPSSSSTTVKPGVSSSSTSSGTKSSSSTYNPYSSYRPSYSSRNGFFVFGGNFGSGNRNNYNNNSSFLDDYNKYANKTTVTDMPKVMFDDFTGTFTQEVDKKNFDYELYKKYGKGSTHVYVFAVNGTTTDDIKKITDKYTFLSSYSFKNSSTSLYLIDTSSRKLITYNKDLTSKLKTVDLKYTTKDGQIVESLKMLTKSKTSAGSVILFLIIIIGIVIVVIVLKNKMKNNGGGYSGGRNGKNGGNDYHNVRRNSYED